MRLKRYLRERHYWGTAGAGAVVYCDATKRVLALKRSQAVDQGGQWTIVVGGAIDSNEDPKIAAKREVFEETQYKGPIKKIDIINKFSDIDEYTQNEFTYHTFKFTIPYEFEPRFNWENDDYYWWDGKERIPGKLHFGARDILKKAKGKIFK